MAIESGVFDEQSVIERLDQLVPSSEYILCPCLINLIFANQPTLEHGKVLSKKLTARIMHYSMCQKTQSSTLTTV